MVVSLPKNLIIFNHHTDEAPGKDIEVQFRRLVGLAAVKGVVGIPGSVESLHSRVMNVDMVGVVVAADRIKGQHHLEA